MTRGKTTASLRFALLIAAAVLTTTFFSTRAFAQSRVYEKDLIGEWRLVIDLHKKGDNALERIVMGAVDGIMDEIDLHFEFMKDGQLHVTTALDEDADDEDTEWRINSKGQLELGDTEHFDSDSVWMMSDGRLYAYEDEDGELVRKEEVYLEKIGR
ncbi:MAG: hypothetical protein KDD65_10015 [Bacteroidetes bacterium]|nr:hypothetical protein [Bacteroidota bacterium]